MKHIFTLFLTIFLFSFAEGQTVKGTVKDASGIPLPGVNIKVIPSNASTISDMDGNFTIAANVGDVIEFSFIGFSTKTVKATTQMTVALAEESSTLTEVVVVGYGTKKLGAVTGSVAQVKAADIVRTPAQSAVQAIQGKAAGVNIVTNDEPGSNPTIRVRGLGTLIAGRDPLYVIDGVETNGLNGINPNDIENMDVLKDASSLAIYGQKGANGVVIVTTKKGKEGKLKVTFDSYYGFKNIQRKVDMADSYQFAYFNNYAMGSSSYLNLNQPYNTNWLDEITRTGSVKSNTMSISGGTENANYYFSAGNYEEEGILIGTEYKRTNLNSRNQFKAFDGKLKISQNFNATIGRNTPKPASLFTAAYKQSPIVPVYFENGRWGQPLRNSATGLVDINGSDRFNNVANPVAQLANTNDQSKNVILFGSVGAELQIFKDLKFNSTFGATYETYKGYSFVDNTENYLITNATKTITDYENTFGDKEVIYNTLTQYQGTNYAWNWDNYLTYTKSIGKHNINVTAGMSRTTKQDNDYLSGTRRNLPENANYWNLSLASYNSETSPGAVTTGTKTTPIVSVAYFGRFEYDYDGKYMLTGILRREGISAFQKSNRWDNFPSVSAGWVVTNEDFLKESKVFNYLKIRGGYGQVGNGNTSNATNNVVFRSGANYTFGSDPSINPGVTIPYEVDPNLTWETMEEIDLGLDFRFLDNRLSGTIDLYDRTSKNVILPVSLPPVLSQEDVVLNTGEISNKGAELSLRWQDKIGDKISYWIGGNISFNKNELTKVTNTYFANFTGGDLGNGQFTKQVLVGEALGSFYVYDVTGFDANGNFTYSDERVVAGSYIPKYTYGGNIGLTYGNIDFSVDIYGVGGNKIFNGKKAQRFGGENFEADYLDSFWTPGNPNAENPNPSNEQPRPSTYFIEDGAFLRINNITLGYTLPEVSKAITKARIYVTAVNPFLFTKYSGFSPESSGSNGGDPLGNAGMELDAYPTNKTFTVGLNLTF
ncbi:SusC/RagA family TonB-linked outer membrane protein [Flavobacterium silvaticum]|uniref:TonB-dependent receptor n=1 Tax=Flavobacterium silvaticum TaxID=1852020 RepID=A0A972FKL9_9FLAO|nr:TonB-dependent receptor [Flavobacterium silvaticum]NMH26965.1 TonB-dependent receptor [Flavobacterium silvaticum]